MEIQTEYCTTRSDLEQRCPKIACQVVGVDYSRDSGGWSVEGAVTILTDISERLRQEQVQEELRCV